MEVKKMCEDDINLFQRTNSLGVKNDNQQEEDEDLEDQKRRQEELQNLIANVFDDIVYEDENTTINSSCDQSTDISKFLSNNLPENTVHVPENAYFQERILSPEKLYSNTDLNGLEQLQILYQVRLKENRELSEQVQELKKSRKEEHDLYQRKNTLLEADIEKLTLSLRQSQNLLMEKNDELNNKIKEVSQLDELLKDLEKTNAALEERITFWKSTTEELQQQRHLIEKNINRQVSENQIKSRYEKEINDLQNALEISNTKLKTLERDFKTVQAHLEEVEYTKGLLIAEKNQMVISMSTNIQNSQEHCQTLLNKISTLQLEKQDIQKELTSFQNKLVEMEKKQLQTNNTDEMTITLRDELKRSLDAQTQKRNEILKLESIIKAFKDKEIILQEKLKTNHEEQEHIKKRYEAVLFENSNLKINLNSKPICVDTAVQTSAKNCEESSQDSNEEENEKLKIQLNILKDKLEEYRSWKNRYLTSEEHCLNLQDNVTQLSSKQSELQVTINTLKEKLTLKEERDSLIDVLKKKAIIFEDYITKKPQSLVSTADKIVDTSDLNLQTKHSVILRSNDQIANEGMQSENSIKISQINILVENEYLKKKLIFDRNAFTKLTDIYIQELKRLSQLIQALNEENNQLARTVDDLMIKDKKYEIIHNDLNSQVQNIKYYIRVIKVISKYQQDRLIQGYERNMKKFEYVLSTLQETINKNTIHVDHKLIKESKEIEATYEKKFEDLRYTM